MLSKEKAKEYQQTIIQIKVEFDAYLESWILNQKGTSDCFETSYISDSTLDTCVQKLFKEKNYTCKIQYADRGNSKKATLTVDLK